MFTLKAGFLKKKPTCQTADWIYSLCTSWGLSVFYHVCLLCLQRPVAMQCLRQMQEPSFPCLSYMLPCDSHSQLFLSQLQGNNAVFWSGHKDERSAPTLDLLKSGF